MLFVDGLDTDRKSDPVPAAGDLAASRPGMKVHVVGFNTDDEDIQARLQKMADAGGGQYIAARKAQTLASQVIAATVGEKLFQRLKAPIIRVGARPCPLPMAPSLERVVLPQVEDLVEAALHLVSAAAPV